MALIVSLLISLDHLVFITQLTVWLLACTRLLVSVVKQKKCLPSIHAFFVLFHYLGTWNRLCDHLEWYHVQNVLLLQTWCIISLDLNYFAEVMTLWWIQVKWSLTRYLNFWAFYWTTIQEVMQIILLDKND